MPRALRAPRLWIFLFHGTDFPFQRASPIYLSLSLPHEWEAHARLSSRSAIKISPRRLYPHIFAIAYTYAAALCDTRRATHYRGAAAASPRALQHCAQLQLTFTGFACADISAVCIYIYMYTANCQAEESEVWRRQLACIMCRRAPRRREQAGQSRRARAR